MRIGPQMAKAVEYVRLHPWCAILPVALHILPRANAALMYGYNPVHRAIKAGLIDAKYDKGRYHLTIKETE